MVTFRCMLVEEVWDSGHATKRYPGNVSLHVATLFHREFRNINILQLWLVKVDISGSALFGECIWCVYIYICVLGRALGFSRKYNNMYIYTPFHWPAKWEIAFSQIAPNATIVTFGAIFWNFVVAQTLQ